jgi:phage major head subunit gpT-like protein
MLLNRTNSEKLFTGFSALFQSAFEATPQYWKMFATIAPSGTTQELYHWIAQLPGMREWVGVRIKNSPVLRDYTLTNKHFEDTIALDKNRVKDDTHGAFSPTVAAFGQAVARWADEQLAAAVEAGTSALCFDGQYFFDDDHPVSLDDASLSTYSNKLAGASYDLSKDPIGVWQAGSEAMAAFKGDSGKPLALVADALMVPPALRRWAVQAAKAELVPQTIKNVAGAENVGVAAVSNIYVGDFTVIVNPYLTTAAAYVMCLNRAIKPFLWQLREAPVFTNLVDPTLPNCFNEKEFIYGAEGRGAPGYTLPQLAVRCTAA